MSLHLPDAPYPLSLALSVSLLILSEATKLYIGSALFKIFASLSFLSAGINAASSNFDLLNLNALLLPDNRFAVCIIIGLSLSALGDAFLIPSKDKYHQKSGEAPKESTGDVQRFKAGVCAFAFAQLAYIVAFLSETSSNEFRWADFSMTLLFGALFTDWLGLLKKEQEYNSWFEVPEGMHGLVMVYMVIIMSMIATATATDKGYQKIAGAWLFMISDLFVAADAFAVRNIEGRKSSTPQWVSRSVGWVLYFGAQLLLAGCI